jgi:hypothetical protein
MFLALILIALFPLSAAEQNEINPINEEKLFEALAEFSHCRRSSFRQRVPA